MSKRPAIDLMALTSEQAVSMPEAAQRAASPTVQNLAPAAKTVTANLESLGFKVSPEFRKRFSRRAANADLFLNELLFEALSAWEEKQGLTD